MKNFKNKLLDILEREDFQNDLTILHNFPKQKVIRTLMTFLYSPDHSIKENAIIGLGEVVSKLAEEDLESARIIIRRLMLSVTEESGGIGWGAPAAMGEIMSRNKKMADEFHHVLISYAQDGDNYLDFEGLQKDVLDGLKRLASVYPDLVTEIDHLLPLH